MQKKTIGFYIDDSMASKLGLSGNELLVMARIYCYSYEGKEGCYLTEEQWAERTGTTRTTIRRTLRNLTEKGYIEKIGQKKKIPIYQAAELAVNKMNGTLLPVASPKRATPFNCFKMTQSESTGNCFKMTQSNTASAPSDNCLILSEVQAQNETTNKDNKYNIEFRESNSICLNNTNTCGCLKEKEKEKENISTSQDILVAEDWTTSRTKYEQFRSDHYPRLYQYFPDKWTQYPQFVHLVAEHGEDKVAAAFARLEADPSFAMAHKWEIDALKAIITDGK